MSSSLPSHSTDKNFFEVERPLEGFKTGITHDEWLERVKQSFGVDDAGWQTLIERSRDTPSPLLPSRNNSKPAQKQPDPWTERPAFRFPRAYVQACGKGTLGLKYESGRIAFSALSCNSWSCPSCRPAKSAGLLDRLRRGLESRPDSNLGLVTPTLDPARFGGVCVGTGYYTQEGQPWQPYATNKTQLDTLLRSGQIRAAKMYAAPTPTQYERAYRAMSKEINRLLSRLRHICKKLNLPMFGYFRVVELHRNGWPHYHLIFQHPTLTVDDVATQLEGWSLGRIHFEVIEADFENGKSAIDVAVGEVAPYLVTSESSHKAYQFAADALPANFRLWTCSRGFLADAQPSESEDPVVQGIALKGHFTDYQRMYEQHMVSREPLSTSLELVHVKKGTVRVIPPQHRYSVTALPDAKKPNQPVRAISHVYLKGDDAPLFFANLVHAETLHVPPKWIAPDGKFSQEDRYKFFKLLVRRS